MANVFVSHRTVDANPAELLAQELQAAGHHIWLDVWEIGLGDSIVGRINEGLQGASYLVLLCSSAGLSPWVDREWMSTLARQLQGHGIKILPAVLGGGRLPPILGDLKFADLGADWPQGVAAILAALR